MKKVLFVMAMLVIVALTLVLTSCSGGKKKNELPGTEDTVRYWRSIYDADSVFPMHDYDDEYGDYKLVKLAMLPGAVTYVDDIYDSRTSNNGICCLELPEGATDIYFGSTDTNVVQIKEINGPADLEDIDAGDSDYAVKITAVNVGKAKIYAAYKLDGKQYHVALPVEVLDFYVELDEETFESWGSNYSKDVGEYGVKFKYNDSHYASLNTERNKTIARSVVFSHTYTGSYAKIPLKITKLDGTSPTNITWSKITLTGDGGSLSITPNGNKAVLTNNSSGSFEVYLVVKVGEYSLPIYIYEL